MRYVLVVLMGLLISPMTFAKFYFPHLAVSHPVHPPHAVPPKGNSPHIVKPINVHPVAPVGGHKVVVVNYHLINGHKFKFGFYYTGWNHNHWSYHYWDTRYGAYLYFDPNVKTYYYWCAPHFRYYPITYAPLGFVFPYVEQPVAPAGPIPDPPAEDAPPPDVAPPPAPEPSFTFTPRLPPPGGQQPLFRKPL